MVLRRTVNPLKPMKPVNTYPSSSRSAAARFRRRIFDFISLAMAVAVAAGCARQPYHAVDLKSAIAHGDPVRVTMKDGRIFVLKKPVVVNDSLAGIIPTNPSREIMVPANEVLRVERMTSGPKFLLAALVGLTLAVLYVQY